MGKLRVVKAGDRFQRLTVIREDEPYVSPKGIPRRKVLCKCDCGNEVSVILDQLRSDGGKTQSCGCLMRGRASESNKIHGESNTPLNIAYRCMKGRSRERIANGEDCQVKFKDYLEFKDFALANGWYEGCHVCREGDTGHYEAGNIRFDTPQSNTEEALAKSYLMISPEGTLVKIYNMRKFCRDNGLIRSSMIYVNQDKLKQHKGWTRFQEECYLG